MPRGVAWTANASERSLCVSGSVFSYPIVRSYDTSAQRPDLGLHRGRIGSLKLDEDNLLSKGLANRAEASSALPHGLYSDEGESVKVFIIFHHSL